MLTPEDIDAAAKLSVEYKPARILTGSAASGRRASGEVSSAEPFSWTPRG